MFVEMSVIHSLVAFVTIIFFVKLYALVVSIERFISSFHVLDRFVPYC